jgi:hypothetical protein
MQAYHLILARFYPRAAVEGRPYRFATLVGVCMGLVSTVLGALIAYLLLTFVPKETLGASAAASLGRLGPWGLAVIGIIFAPLWETLIAQLLPVEMGKLIGFQDISCIVLGAILFGAGHYLNGGLAHGICAAIAGAIFTTAYLTMRPWGYFPAFWASYVAHALNNLLLILI